jgi:hypothetical protein
MLPILKVKFVAFSGAGARLAVGYTSGEVRVFDTEGGALLQQVGLNASDIGSLEWDLDDSYLLMGTWDMEGGRVIRWHAPPFDRVGSRDKSLAFTNLRVCRETLTLVPMLSPPDDSPWAPEEACREP